MNSNNPPNRLHLNFGFNNNNNERNFAAEQGRAYPTTPSTFPQPVFPNQAGQQEVWGTQQTNNGYGAGYFMTNPYQPKYQQQANIAAPNAAYRAPGYNDGLNGLNNQFSHQNLGGNARSASPYGRQPSPGQRPRTGGATGQQQYGNYLSAPSSTPDQHAPSLNDEAPPPKNPDKYAENVQRKAKVSIGTVSTFFKDNVQRARDRNARHVYDISLACSKLTEYFLGLWSLSRS